MASLPSAASPTLEGGRASPDGGGRISHGVVHRPSFTRGARRAADGSLRSTTMGNPRTRQAVVAVSTLIGGFLLSMCVSSESDVATGSTSFWAGLNLFVVVAWLLLRWYHPGTDVPSDEVAIRE